MGTPTSSMHSPAVVVTNQVAGNPCSGNSRVTLGHVWHHAVNWRLVLSHVAPGSSCGYGLKENAVGSSRFLNIEKSPCSPPISIEYVIGRAGLSEIGVLEDPAYVAEQPQPVPLGYH